MKMYKERKIGKKSKNLQKKNSKNYKYRFFLSGSIYVSNPPAGFYEADFG